MTLAAVAAVAGALLVAGVAVVIATGQSDRRDVDRQLRGFSEQVVRRAGPVYGGLPAPPAPPGGPGESLDGGRGGRDGAPGGAGPGDAPGRGGRDGDGGLERDRRGPLEPGADSFARVLLSGGEVVSGGANVPAGFPGTPVGQIETVKAGGQEWRTLVRPLGPDSRVQVAAGLHRLDPPDRRNREAFGHVGTAADHLPVGQEHAGEAVGARFERAAPVALEAAVTVSA
ncbi:MAG: hypothetical protein ACKOTH_04445, partial [Solirubrobacterales bacterium]